MSLADHVRSEKNLELIRTFALKKLQGDWPKQKSNVLKAIELCLQDSIDSIIDTYKGWAVSAANIAEINVHVWRTLKQNVIHAMKGAQAEPEETLRIMFEERGSVMPQDETKIEGVISEHEHEALRDKYLEAWRN